MAEVTQYSFSWLEVTELLIKKQNIHDGNWIVVVEYGIAAGMFGQNESDIKPGVLISGNSLQLVKAQPNAPTALVVDAATVNPKS